MNSDANGNNSLLPLCRDSTFLDFGFISPCYLHILLPIALDSYLLIFAIIIWLNRMRKTRIRRQYRSNLNFLF